MESACRTCTEALDRWMAEAWEGSAPPAALPQEVMGHVRECPACAVRLEAARQLIGDQSYAGGQYYTQCSPDLGRRIGDRVIGQISGEKRLNEGSARGFWRSQIVLTAAALLIVTMLSLISGIPREQQAALMAAETYETVRLQVRAPLAQEVAVAGDWNDWDPEAQPLERIPGSDLWVIELELQPGRDYRYQFVIDGDQWISDPQVKQQIDDGFGGVNSLLVI